MLANKLIYYWHLTRRKLIIIYEILQFIYKLQPEYVVYFDQIHLKLNQKKDII